MSLQELAIALSRKLDFTKVLSDKVRALAEEGDYNKSILSLWKYGKLHLQFYNQGANFSVFLNIHFYILNIHFCISNVHFFFVQTSTYVKISIMKPIFLVQ